MIRFEQLEDLGLRLAAMSDRSDGDCAGVDFARFVARFGYVRGDVATVRQVHGAAVVDAADAGVEADALLTADPARPIAIRVADCVPLFLYDPVKHAGALVHAGREGTRKGIASAAVAELGRRCGCAPENIHAVIGPSAGACCYEVAPEMAAEFAVLGLPVAGRRLDLWGANALQLAAAGLTRSHIHVAGECTICTDRYHSYRRDKAGGRNAALLAI